MKANKVNKTNKYEEIALDLKISMFPKLLYPCP